MIGIVKKNWLLAVEIAVAVGFFVLLVRPVADQGGGTVPVIALVFGATSIALHRVAPGFAFASLAFQVLTLFAFGFGGRTAPLELWAGAPLVLFSAAFFGRRATATLSLSGGVVTWLAITAQSVGQTMYQHVYDPDNYPFDGVALPDAVLLNSQIITLSALALVAPPVLGAVLRHRLRRSPLVPTSEPTPPTLAEYAKSVSLTAREQRVFELAAQGLTNAEIAAAEHVSEATVKSQMTRVLAKVQARDRVQLAIDAHRRGLFDRVS